MARKILIRLEDVNVSLNGQRVLSGISWRLKEQENWAILGPNGSGKSTLLRLIRGDLWPDPPGANRRTYSFNSSIQHSPVGVREHLAMISPELQERYSQQDWVLTGETVVHTGFFLSDLLYERLDRKQTRSADAIMDSLGINSLRRKNVQEMSTGELRKILLARALVGRPQVLILDEFCDGLDAESRIQLLNLVERVPRAGTQILYTTHRADELVSSLSHVLRLEQGKIVEQAKRKAFYASQHRLRPQCLVQAKAEQRGEIFETTTQRPGSVRLRSGTVVSQRCLVRIMNADVFVNRKKILHRINWRMNANENWAILGANGSGKSTLLKLILGDLSPALSGQIHRFPDHGRLSAWQARQRIGYVSADLQANYRAEITGEEIVASGFFSSVGLVEKPSQQQLAAARRLIRHFGLGALSKKTPWQMSYGELRKLLLLRAVVHAPLLLLLDEPFDGLDTDARAQLDRMLDQIVRRGTGLIIVTHHPHELPFCVTHALHLAEGRVIAQRQIVLRSTDDRTARWG